MPSEYEHKTLFFRNIAYQQFLYQINFGYSYIARQSIIFSSLPDNHVLKIEFKRITRLEIQDFLDLSFITLVKFLTSNVTILKPGWYTSTYTSYPEEKVRCFLDSVSKDINEARKSLLQRDKGKRWSFEQYEYSPFLEFPLIQVPSGYLLTHKNILFRSMEYFVYDTLRHWNAERFMGKWH